MTRHPSTHIVGPAAWAPYLINGDASGLEPGERAKADAWLKREGVRIVDTEPDAEPYFSNAGLVYVPELGCRGFEALDYRAEELTLEPALPFESPERAALRALVDNPTGVGELTKARQVLADSLLSAMGYGVDHHPLSTFPWIARFSAKARTGWIQISEHRTAAAAWRACARHSRRRE